MPEREIGHIVWVWGLGGCPVPGFRAEGELRECAGVVS